MSEELKNELKEPKTESKAPKNVVESIQTVSEENTMDEQKLEELKKELEGKLEEKMEEVKQDVKDKIDEIGKKVEDKAEEIKESHDKVTDTKTNKWGAYFIKGVEVILIGCFAYQVLTSIF